MTTLTQAHQQWARRPSDERFVSLDEMAAFTRRQRTISQMGTIANRNLSVAPVEDDPRSIAIMMDDDRVTAPSHWAFGQLCQLVGAPASYMRTLPSDLVSDCLNQSMAQRKVEQVGWLSREDQLSAVTGPTYGRIWNADVVDALVRNFGSGPDAQFTVPGEFGQQVTITKTTPPCLLVTVICLRSLPMRRTASRYLTAAMESRLTCPWFLCTEQRGWFVNA
jgi:hypothetical protein